MYHVRNSCKINIIWNRSMHDRDASIFHEFSQDFLLNISNYYYGNTVNRCYCTTIKHINKVLSSVISFAKKKAEVVFYKPNVTASFVLFKTSSKTNFKRSQKQSKILQKPHNGTFI